MNVEGNIGHRNCALVIGAFHVDKQRNQITNGPNTLALEPQIMDVLCALADKPGEVISRDDLIEQVWNVQFGGDESLTRAISILRKKFKKAGETSRYIETIYKRGYRLNAPVSKGKNPNEAKPASTPGKSEISIAVLAFEDISTKSDQAYFSSGVSEEIINSLARLPFLRVIGRTSSFSFRGQSVSIPDIAKALNVSHILEGSVRKDGDKLRITVQLIKAEDDTHLWSETFDGNLEDAFELQEIIAGAVEQELKSIFGGTESRPQKTCIAETDNEHTGL